jgi:hypothetical protein
MTETMTQEQRDDLVEAINALCEQALEYETTHDDAGGAYEFMVPEGWADSDTDRLVSSLHNLPDVDPRFARLDPDQIAAYALDSVRMEPGSIFGPLTGIVLGAWPVQEIEITLHDIATEAEVQAVAGDCDAYISDSGFAYMATDAVWFALLDVDMFNAYVDQHMSDHPPH